MSISRACRILNLHRSVFYYPSEKDDGELIAAIERHVEAHPQHGFWKTFESMRQQGKPWSHKKVHRVYKAMGLTIKRREKPRYPLRVRDLLSLPTELNHTWSIELVGATIMHWENPSSGQRTRFKTIYSFQVMDEHSREALDVEADFSLRTEHVVQALDRLIESRGMPKHVRIENHPELVVSILEEWGHANQVEVNLISQCELYPTPLLGGLNYLLGRKSLPYYLFPVIATAGQYIQAWIQEYNTLPQEALEGLSPADYAQATRKGKRKKLRREYYYHAQSSTTR